MHHLHVHLVLDSLYDYMYYVLNQYVSPLRGLPINPITLTCCVQAWYGWVCARLYIAAQRYSMHHSMLRLPVFK